MFTKYGTSFSVRDNYSLSYEITHFLYYKTNELIELISKTSKVSLFQIANISEKEISKKIPIPEVGNIVGSYLIG